MFKSNGLGACKRAARRVFIFTTALLWASHSQAIIYSYNGPGVGYNNAAGEVLDIVGKYDSTAQLFSWSATFGRNSDGKLANGFWLVVSNGPNPKDLAPGSELAIFYVDARPEKTAITAYQYDSEKGEASYQDPTGFLGSFTGLSVASSVDRNTRIVSFNDLDVSGINASLNDPGVSFANKIGIWMHPVVLNKNAEYYGKKASGDHKPGMIKDWQHNSQGWYESESECTVGFNKPDCEGGGSGVEVPEPSTMLLFLAAILGLGAIVHRPRLQIEISGLA